MGSTEFTAQARIRCPPSKLIMISAVEVAKEQAQKLGMEFLQKRLTPDTLVNTIQTLK
jgi:hypothetical protein